MTNKQHHGVFDKDFKNLGEGKKTSISCLVIVTRQKG